MNLCSGGSSPLVSIFLTRSSVVELSAVNRAVASSSLAESVHTNLAQLGERRFYKPRVVGSSPTVRIAH